MTADIYTRISAEAERDAAFALEWAIYGDLFVPSYSRYREQGQLRGAKLGQGIVTAKSVTVNKKGA